MEIRALSLRVTQEEVVGWIERLLADQERVRGLGLHLTPAGPRVRGEAAFMGMWFPFEAEVEVGADGAYVVLRLANVRAAGSVPIPRSMILSQLAKHRQPWLRIEEEAVVVDVERLLEGYGVSLSANLSGLRFEEGAFVLEAQIPAGRTPAAP